MTDGQTDGRDKKTMVVLVIDGICLLLFVSMGVYIFALSGEMQDLFLPAFTIINPYRTGGWIMAFGFLATCLWGKGRTGLVLGVVMLICYLLTAFVSLFGMLIVTSNLDLLWYLHFVPAIIACIIAIRRKRTTIKTTQDT